MSETDRQQAHVRVGACPSDVWLVKGAWMDVCECGRASERVQVNQAHTTHTQHIHVTHSDPKAPKPRPPDIALLLCEAHGFPLIPPHVQSFLEGEKRVSTLERANGGESLVVDRWVLDVLFPSPQ